MKLYYFDSPGRAEMARIMLHVGAVPFEDVRFDREEWASNYKALSPSGQVPMLELDDGRKLVQTSAITYYAAQLSGFLPTDPWQVARALEIDAHLEDNAVQLFKALEPTFVMKDQEEATAARKEAMAPGGAAHKILSLIDKRLSESETKYFAGDTPTLTDVSIFVPVCSMSSGQLGGFDKEAMAPFKKMNELRDKFAAEPKVKEYYAQKGEEAIAYKCFA